MGAHADNIKYSCPTKFLLLPRRTSLRVHSPANIRMYTHHIFYITGVYDALRLTTAARVYYSSITTIKLQLTRPRQLYFAQKLFVL